MSAVVDSGSFRDPRGRVYLDAGRVFRTVTSSGIADYAHVRDTGLYEKLIAEKRLVGIDERDASKKRPSSSSRCTWRRFATTLP
jgi:hypothetical protein